MCLRPAAAQPETRGLDCRVDLIDPHVRIPNVVEVPPYNRAAMMADREEVGKEVAVEGTSSAKGVMKTTGQTTIREASIVPTVRVIPATMGETQGIDKS